MTQVEEIVGKRLKPSEEDIIAYLWANVAQGEADQCWPWTRSASVKGRGVVSFQGFRALAPRVAFRAKTGEWPPSDMMVCHSCDNPPCCNPAHLWLGTARDNLQDMANKGRMNPLSLRGGGWRKSLTSCKRGHEFTPENTGKNSRPGGRKCKACQRLSRAAHRSGVSIEQYLLGMET